MSRRNNGNFISATEQATDSNTANGIFTLTDAARKTALGSFPTGRFTPSRSLRFRSSNSAYLSRTFGTPTNQSVWTYSVWLKRGVLTTEYGSLLGRSGTTLTYQFLTTTNKFGIYDGASTASTPVFRDTSAWYHIVLKRNSAASLDMYVNNVLIMSDTGTTAFNVSGATYYIGRSNAGEYFDGYMAEVNFIDGQALMPSSFGLTDPETGTWVPKPYSGTYGNNGFYLPFTDTSAADLTDQVPTMSSATAPSGTASASTEQSGTYAAWKAFDKNAASYWFATATTGWLKYQYATAATITAYSLACDGNGYGPSGWTFEGSNDNSNWTVLDTRSGYGSTLTTTPVYFYCSNSTAYIYYRLNCTGAATAGNLAIDSFAMYNNAGLGKDFSTNTNVWHTTGIIITSGVTYDSMVDVPGIASVSSAVDVGNVQRGNYAVMNPLFVSTSGSNVITNGNLLVTGGSSGANNRARATISIDSGKWYWEVSIPTTGSGSGDQDYGVIITASSNTGVSTSSAETNYGSSGNVYKNGVSWSYGTPVAWTVGDVMGCAYDFSAGTVAFYKNNTLVTTVTGLDSSPRQPHCTLYTTNDIMNFNFGQRPFIYTPPTGFKSLCTTNLPNPSIKRPTDQFDVKTWSGNGKALTVGNIAKQTTATQIPKSLRFRASATAYLSKTFSNAPTSANTQTRSLWIKRGAVSSSRTIWTEYNSGNGKAAYLSFAAAGHINAQISNGGTGYSFKTIDRYQDPSAWYHIVWVIDSTAAVNNNRMKVYVNGVLQAIENQTYVAQNTDIGLTASGTPIGIGIYDDFSSEPLDGYLAEFYNIDGQALTPSSFGQFDSNNNWFPKAYTGTYGNHGFYLPFNDPTSTTTIGYDRQLGLTDSSKNNWTSSGISVATATIADRSTYDSMYDSPTDGVDSSGNTIGNFATFDPRETGSIYTQTLSQGNLTLYTVNDGYGSTLAMYTGKWYWEFVIDARVGGGSGTFGIMDATIVNTVAGDSISNMYGSVGGAPSVGYNSSDGHKYIKTLTAGGVDSAYGTSYTTGDIIGNALDLDANTITFYKNGVSQGAIPLPQNNNGWRARMQVGGGTSLTYSINFGQRPFSYTPPTGHLSLNTKNLRDVGSYNLPDTYGNFVNTPDLVWIKNRNSTQTHVLFDSVRGPTNYLSTVSLSDETVDTATLTEFSPNGFKLGSGSSLVNTAANTYVAWCWNAGSSTVTNNDGSIPSMVRANPAAGFSIATYYGNAVTGATVGHGLGVPPQFFFILGRTGNVSQNHRAYHAYQDTTPQGGNMLINSYTAYSADTGEWNNTAPSSSVVTFGATTAGKNNSGASYVMYSWAPVPGYSAFGSYTGNGSADGPFVWTGFRSRFVLVKASTSATDWYIYDTARDTYNLAVAELNSNLTAAEQSNVYGSMDVNSNGFKLRFATGEVNASGATYIYAAFAESPFKYANAR